MKRIILAISALALALALFVMTSSPRTALAYSNKTTSHYWAISYNLILFGVAENVNEGIDQYRSGAYVTVVTLDNWGIVVPNGASGYPESMAAASSAYVRDSNNNYWSIPNNYPYCFVNQGDAYSCGSSQTISQGVYDPNYQAVAYLHGAVYTYDDFFEVLITDDGIGNGGPTWYLNTF